ncbi:hypothetical protein VKT23_001473 [Stygiomarasmius scandens]|uniref:Uncharacterized protein n=1 Tax=Marasmiellus scandens TaxID=2682957 RepID=A0ABR1K0D1_9AGAR
MQRRLCDATLQPKTLQPLPSISSQSNAKDRSRHASHIAGNASPTIKELFTDPVTYFNVYAKGQLSHGFAETVVARITTTEVSILDDPEEKERKQARIVCRMTVEEGGSFLW